MTDKQRCECWSVTENGVLVKQHWCKEHAPRYMPGRQSEGIAASDLTQQQRDEIGAEYLETLIRIIKLHTTFMGGDYLTGFLKAVQLFESEAAKLRSGGE